jgi:hypothetical protein
MYSYNLAGPSAYTEIKSGTTHPVGLSETIGNSFFRLFPNPAGDHIQLELHGAGWKNISICLYDFTGKQVLADFPEKIGNYYFVDVSQLPSGMYLVLLQSDTQRFIRKLIIE